MDDWLLGFVIEALKQDQDGDSGGERIRKKEKQREGEEEFLGRL